MAEKTHNFIDGNNIYIYDTINESFAEDIINPFRKEIENQAKLLNPCINIYINSLGGLAKMAFTMINVIEDAKKRGIVIKTIVEHEACSGGSLIAIAGTKGERYISKYGEHYCHLGYGDLGRISTDLQLERNTENMKRFFNTIRKIYKTYASIPNLTEKLKDDNYYIYPEDCITFGLADKII